MGDEWDSQNSEIGLGSCGYFGHLSVYVLSQNTLRAVILARFIFFEEY